MAGAAGDDDHVLAEVPTSSAVMYRPPSDSTRSPKSRSSASRSAPAGASVVGRADHALAAAQVEAGGRSLERHATREAKRVRDAVLVA